MKILALITSLVVLQGCGGAQDLATAIEKASQTKCEKNPEDEGCEKTTSSSTTTTTTSPTVVTANTGKARQVTEAAKQDAGIIRLTDDLLNEHGCTDFALEGDFDVAVEIGRDNVKLKAFFDRSECNTKSIGYEDGVVTGLICEGGGTFEGPRENPVFSPKRGMEAAEDLMIHRWRNFLHWRVFMNGEWKTVYERNIEGTIWKNAVEFCVIR